MKVKYFSSLLVLNIFFILSSCDKNKPGPADSSCNASLADTSFQIQELVGLGDSMRFFSTDTIIASQNYIYFTATDTTADEYSWQIDSDPTIFTGNTFKLKFTSATGVFNIKLLQKRRETNSCYGKLPSEVTYTKRLTVVNDAEALPITGSYYGYNLSDTSRKFIVSVLANGVNNIPFPTGKSYNFWNEISYGSTALYIAGSGTYDPENGAYATSGFGYLKNNNRVLQIEYSYKMPTTTGFSIVRDKFIGLKQ